MPTAKRLKNSEGLRGTPSVGSAPLRHKRGLKGGTLASRRHKDNRTNDPRAVLPVVYSLDEGEAAIAGGEAGLGGGTNTFVGRGSASVKQKGDNRSVLDSDRVPVGASDIAVLATFTVATGVGASSTFAATPANAGGSCQVAVYALKTDTDEDGNLLVETIINADGTAQTVTVAGHAGETVAVYCRRVSAAPRSFGRWFATRRTVVLVA